MRNHFEETPVASGAVRFCSRRFFPIALFWSTTLELARLPANSIDTLTSFAGLTSAETTQSGFCHAGTTSENMGRKSRAASAANQMEWHIAADARRSVSINPPAMAITRMLLIDASTNDVKAESN